LNSRYKTNSQFFASKFL